MNIFWRIGNWFADHEWYRVSSDPYESKRRFGLRHITNSFWWLARKFDKE